MSTAAKATALIIVAAIWLTTILSQNSVLTSEYADLVRIVSCQDHTPALQRDVITKHHLLVEPSARLDVKYEPSYSEEYAIAHAEELGYLATTQENLKPSCKLLTDPSLPVHESLQKYRKELAAYAAMVKGFKTNVTDLRDPLRQGTMTRDALCTTVDLNLAGVFNESQQLSHGSFGYAEPIIPPLRHPDFCFVHRRGMSLEFLVHDWKVLCQRLTPFSKTVFIDMGASLTYHSGNSQAITPAVYILETYKKFGFQFDHVYAYEVTQQEPAQVFQLVPEDLFPNYHWVNVGVSADPNDKMNPLRMLLNKYTEDDFVVIKLDIDTGSVELPLAYQLLNDDRYSKLVDQLYFEHHVFQHEMAPYWKSSMEGSLKASLDLFRGLREKGIASHYWI